MHLYRGDLNKRRPILLIFKDSNATAVYLLKMSPSRPCAQTELINKLSHKIPDIRHRALHNVLGKLERGLLPAERLDDVVERSFAALGELNTDHFTVIIKVLYYASLYPNSCQSFFKCRGIEVLSNFLSENTLHPHFGVIKSILHNLQANSESKLGVPLSVDYSMYSKPSLHSEEDATCTVYVEPKSYSIRKSPNHQNKNNFESLSIDPSLLLNSKLCSRQASARQAVTRLRRVTPHSAKFRFERLPRSQVPEKDYEHLSKVLRSLSDGNSDKVLLKLRHFDSVILNDYPIELIIQKPVFIQLLSALIATSTSTHVIMYAAGILVGICHRLTARLHYFENPINFRVICDPVDDDPLTADSLSYNLKLIFDEQSMSSSLCSSLLPSSAFVIDEDPSIPTICVALMSAALSGLTATGVADCGLTGRHLGKRITVFAPLLRLLNTATDLFLFCLRPSVRSTEGKVKGTFAQSARPGGDAEGTLTFDLLSATKPTNCDRLPTQNITPGFENMLELWGVMMSTFGKAWRSDLDVTSSSAAFFPEMDEVLSSVQYSRYVYIALVRTLFHFLSSVWSPESCSFVLPNVTAFELSLALLDPYLTNLCATTGVEDRQDVGLPAYVRFLNPEASNHWSSLVALKSVMRSSIAFVYGVKSLGNCTKSSLEGLMKHAINGLEAVEFFSGGFIREFVTFLAELPMRSEESVYDALLTQGRPHLLFLMAHPSANVRRTTYATISRILLTSISIREAADPTTKRYKRIIFALSPEVLGELVEFGIHDPMNEISSLAKGCVRVLLDAHQLIPVEMWQRLLNLLTHFERSPTDLKRLTKLSSWTPLQPLLLGIAPLANKCSATAGSANVEEDEDHAITLSERSLEACLGLGGFESLPQTESSCNPKVICKDLRSCVFLLFLPQPAVRLEAATQILRRLDSIFNLFTTSVSITQTPTISAATDTAITTAASPTLIVDDVIELTSLQEVESTLCDLLLFPEARPVLDINFDEIYRLQSASPTISLPQPFQMSYNNSTAGRGSVFESESKTLAEAFTNVLNLTSSEIAEVGVRCTAGDQVLAVLLSPDGMKYWREANGPNIAVDWVSSLPSKLETLARKLLIEPVIRIQLSVLQFVITHDNETRIQLATNPATLYAFMLTGLCFWKDDKIRHCISHSIALLMLQPVIRDSDGCPICLPESVAAAYCLPFSCPVYSIKSRHNAQSTRFSHALHQLSLLKKQRHKGQVPPSSPQHSLDTVMVSLNTTAHTTTLADKADDEGEQTRRRHAIAVGATRTLRAAWSHVCGISIETLLELPKAKEKRLIVRSTEEEEETLTQLDDGGSCAVDGEEYVGIAGGRVNDFTEKQTLCAEPLMKLSPTDAALLLASDPQQAFSRALRSIRNARAHAEVFMGLAHLRLVVAAFWRTTGVSRPKKTATTATLFGEPCDEFRQAWWSVADLQRFFKVLPSCTADFYLLLQCVDTIAGVDFTPPFCSSVLNYQPRQTLETANWLLSQLLEPNSPLAYAMRRFDAGIGGTDSQRLVEVKQRMHFDTLPTLFEGLLACQDSLGDRFVTICGKALRADKPAVKRKKAYGTDGGNTLGCITTLSEAAPTEAKEPADNSEALHFLFQWAIKFIEIHLNSPSDRINALHIAIKIVERITLRENWKLSVQQISPALQGIFGVTARLVSMLLGAEKGFCRRTRTHTGLIYSCLCVMHNGFLLLTCPRWNSNVVSSLVFGDEWFQTPWLFRLLDHTCVEVRFMAITVIAQACLQSTLQEDLVRLQGLYAAEMEEEGIRCTRRARGGSGLWCLGLEILSDPTESPKMRAGAAHLLTNLTTLFESTEVFMGQVYLPPRLVCESALSSMLLSSPEEADLDAHDERNKFLRFLESSASDEATADTAGTRNSQALPRQRENRSHLFLLEEDDDADEPCPRVWTFNLSVRKLADIAGLPQEAVTMLHDIAYIQNPDINSMESREDADDLNFNVASIKANSLSPVFIEPITKIHVVGAAAIYCLLESFGLFQSVHNMLKNYHPSPTLQKDLWKSIRQRRHGSGKHSAPLSSEVYMDTQHGDSAASRTSVCPTPVAVTISPPQLISHVCSLLVNLSCILPHLLLRRLTQYNIPVQLMNIIDPYLLHSLAGGIGVSAELQLPTVATNAPTHPGSYLDVSHVTACHLAPAFAESLRLFRSLVCTSESQKLFFLSDCRFLTLLANSLALMPDSKVNLEPLWQEQMLFFISLLEPETEDPADLLLRHALHPLSARAAQWGTLINQLLRRTLDINAVSFASMSTSSRLPDDADASRRSTFELTRTALTFLSVVLSRRASRTLEVLKQESESKPSSIKSRLSSISSTSYISTSHHDQHPVHTASSYSSQPMLPLNRPGSTDPMGSYSATRNHHFDNPIPAALDAALAERYADGESEPLSGSIAVALATMATAFPQARISLDGSLQDSPGDLHGDSNPLTFGHSVANRQAVHSALKILLCTSPKAKLAVLEAGFLSTLISQCQSVLTKLNLILRYPMKLKNIGCLDSAKAPPEISAPTPAEKQALESRQIAWQHLTEDLLRYLELLGNMIYGSPEIKQAAIEVSFPKLAQTIWPLALIDTRLMHGLLFCLINFSADSPSASSAILTCSGPLKPSSVLRPPTIGNAVGGNSLAKLLERLLDSSLYWYNRLGASYRPETDGKVMAKCSQWLRSNRLPAEDSTEAVTFLRDFTMRQVFELLANLAWSSEALSSFSKVKLLVPAFTSLDPKSLAKSPRGQHLQRLWLRFITNLTFTHEGQSLLMATTGAVDVLLECLKACRGENLLMAFTCLQNLCGNASFKTYLYKKSLGLVSCLASALEPKSSAPPELYVQSLTALLNASFNCSKFRVLLKTEGFVHTLNNLKTFCQETKHLAFLVPDVDLLLQAITQ